MQTVSLIQIGDIHFPETRHEVVGDIKDSALAGNVANHVAPKKLAKVFQHMARLRESSQRCGILICGDLTTRGDLQSYKECIEYLTGALNLSSAAHEYDWHAVPGNHDVARKLLLPGESPFPTLFQPLATAWMEAIGRDPLSINSIRTTSLSEGNCHVALHSLNSCLGCGEWRRIPESIRSRLAPNIKTIVDGEPDINNQFSMLSEQLDAPFFDDAIITLLCTTIETLNPNAVPVVLAHHNLLPQATPRLDIYTELLNGGVVRARLGHLARPVIYCHGHIHQSPIELLSLPEVSGSLVLSVAAPEITTGYNYLQFSFSRAGLPLGIEVCRYELTTDGDVRKASSLRVSFSDNVDSFASLSAEICDAVRACERVASPLTRIRDRMDPKPQFDSLADRLREAEWHGLVRILNREATVSRDLRIERVVP